MVRLLSCIYWLFCFFRFFFVIFLECVLVGDGQDLHVVLPRVDCGRSLGSNGSP